MRFTRRIHAALGSAFLLAAVMAGSPAHAAPAPEQSGDLLIPNYSFESGADGWTLGHTAAPVPKPDPGCDVSASTDQHATGAASLWLQAASGCVDPAALSGAVTATPGQSYTADLRIFGSAMVLARLVFQDAQHHVVDVVAGAPKAAPNGEWTTLTASAAAPAGTASVSVGALLVAGGSAYVDDVAVTAQRTNLGAQITSSAINAVTFGHDAQGNSTGYAVVTGNDSYDARLIGVNAQTGALTVNLPLPGATGAWAATTASDGTIYVGSYNYDNTDEGGRLYRYTPGANAVEDLGNPIVGDTFVWNLTAGPDGSVFGGGYPSGGAFSYSAAAGFQQVGDRPLVAPEQYARSVAYDPSNDMLYVGIGAHAHLMACPGGGSQCTDILPSQYADEEFAYSVSAGDGYVFANMSSSGNGHLVVLKVTKTADGSVSATVVKNIPNVKYPGASAVVDGGVYFAGGPISRYDIATNTVTSSGKGLPVAPRAWGFDNGRLLTMGGSTNGPTLVRYDIGANTVSSVTAADAPTIPTDIQSIQAGPDGRIYSSGFRSAIVGSYTPLRSDLTTTHSGISQAEGSTVIGDTIYWGTYPGAVIYAYTPSQPWKSGTNPKVVCTLTDQDQDRPYGMVDAGGKLYIGTEAGYGKLQGALSIYDPATGNCTTQKNVVPDETITSLAYYDGKVYGGTSIWGGLGIDPTQKEAKLLIADTATGTTTTVDLPTRGLRSVLAVTVGPDHRIWMVAEDHILVYDPATQRFVQDRAVFPELHIHDSSLIDAHDAFLTVGADGNLYGTIHGAYLYRIDPKTMRTTVLVTGKVHHVVPDEFGNLYYVENGYELHRLVIR